MVDTSKIPSSRILFNNVLDYKNITNCITEIPQDIKLELNNGILTLKAGSKVYFATGTVDQYETFVLSEDFSHSGTFTNSVASSDVLITVTKTSFDSAPQIPLKWETVSTTPTGDEYNRAYDSTNNNMWYRQGGTENWTLSNNTISFPIAIVHLDENKNPVSIKQVFNGFGFMGSTVFILPGVKGLAPNGRNTNGSLNNTILINSNIVQRTFSNTLEEYVIYLNSSSTEFGIQISKLCGLDEEKNLIYELNSSGQFNRYIPSGTASIVGKFIVENSRITSLMPKLPIRVPDIQEVVTKQEYLTENEIQQQIFNRIYDGRDLTKVFADEIANYSDEWAWIKARIASANYNGLYVGDYIPVTMNAGTIGGTAIAQQTFQCQIAGIDTYTGCGDVEIGHHIDFISREVIDTEIVWNPVDNNNGTSVQANPWLASNAYAWLNGVNNYTTSAYNNVAHGGNYANAGILQLLPTKLSNLIVTKRNLLDSRYDSTKLLTYSTGWAWGDMGKLWLPNELEAYGFQVRSNLGYAQGYWNPEANIGVSYPIYANSGRNRIKRTSTGGRSTWWLSSADGRSSTDVCYCNGLGYANSYLATLSGIRCPLCFRIA